MSVTIQIALSLEVLLRHLGGGLWHPRTRRVLGEVWLLSVALSPVTSEGVRWLISSWSGGPNGRLQVTPRLSLYMASPSTWWALLDSGVTALLMINVRQTSGCHYQWQQTRAGRCPGWCGHLTTIRTSYKENLTYPVITVCPAQRDWGIGRSDFRPGGKCLLYLFHTFIYSEVGGPAETQPPQPGCSCRGRAPSCLGQEASAWLQADGLLMLLQALEFGQMEMDGRILSGINNLHPPQRRVPSSGTPLHLLVVPPEASSTARSFLLSGCGDWVRELTSTTHQIWARHVLGIFITFSLFSSQLPVSHTLFIPMRLSVVDLKEVMASSLT